MSPRRNLGRVALALTASWLGAGAVALPAAAAPSTPSPPAAAAPCPCPPRAVLPVALYALEASWGWSLTFLTPPCPPLVELRVGVDGGKPRSLGSEGSKDPLTHQPAARHTLVLAPATLAGGKIAADDDHKLAVELVRPGGRVDGPYTLLFSPREERLAAAKLDLARHPRTWVSFAEHGSVYTWLGFHSLFGMRGSLREARYSVNDCSLRHRLTFSAHDGVEPTADFRSEPDDLTFERPFLSLLRESTSSSCVQVVFTDGTVSETLELKRNAKAEPH